MSLPPTLDVALTPELRELVAQQVSSGRYASASEVIAAALRLQAHSEPDVSALGAAESERRRSEAALRESEARLRSLGDNLPFAMIYQVAVSADGRQRRFLHVSKSCEALNGVTAEQAMADPNTLYSLFAPEDRDRVMALDAHAVATRTPFDTEARFVLPDGRVRWFRLVSAPREATGGGTIWDGVQVDITDRKDVELKLDETNRRLSAVLDNASVSVFLMNDRQHCVYMNAAAEKMSGYRLSETQGRPLHDVVHHTRPDGTPYPLEECPIDRAFPEQHQMQGEDVFVHKDGRFYPVAFTASPIRDAASQTVGTIIEVRDITTEKKNEQARNLLIGEVDHRARNALMVVQSILQLTPADDLAAYKKAALGRISSLARAHASLATRRWEGAGLHEVLQGELNTLVAPVRYSLEGPDIAIAPEQVQPLSMLAHELATNAVKHGSLSAEGGRVQVTWAAETEGALALSWRELGGPPVSPPTHSGFGSRLIRQLAEQLEAAMSYDWSAQGMAVKLTIPALRREAAGGQGNSTPRA